MCGVVADSSLSGVSAPHTQEFGSALFPTLLLLNHACDTNTLRINMDGNKVNTVQRHLGYSVLNNVDINHWIIKNPSCYTFCNILI